MASVRICNVHQVPAWSVTPGSMTRGSFDAPYLVFVAGTRSYGILFVLPQEGKFQQTRHHERQGDVLVG